MKLKWPLAVLAFLGLTFSSAADARTEMCHSCTDQQMELIAWNQIGLLKLYGPLYLVDLDRGVARRYVYRDNMTPEFNPETDALDAWVESTPVEPQLVTAVQGISQEITTMKQEQAEVLLIPSQPGLPSSAYDALMNTAQHNALIDYIAEHNKFNNVFLNWLSQFDIPWLNEDYFAYPQPIKYETGDTAIYVYNKDTLRWERAPGSSRDAAGNSIPETKPEIAGPDGGYREYDFVDITDPNVVTALDNFQDYVRLNGFRVEDTTSGQVPGSGGFYTATCAGDVCTIWYIY